MSDDLHRQLEDAIAAEHLPAIPLLGVQSPGQPGWLIEIEATAALDT